MLKFSDPISKFGKYLKKLNESSLDSKPDYNKCWKFFTDGIASIFNPYSGELKFNVPSAPKDVRSSTTISESIDNVESKTNPTKKTVIIEHTDLFNALSDNLYQLVIDSNLEIVTKCKNCEQKFVVKE